MAISATDRLVVLLHGVGSNGRDIGGLGELWQGGLPACVFAAPDAPHNFDGGGSGFQWFSVREVTAENRAQRVAAARAGFDALLRNIIETHGLLDKLDRVALVGFSQGSIMALDAVASGRWPVGAVAAFSGRLATPQPFAPAKTPILLVHGGADTVIPAAESRHAETALREAGYTVDCHILDGIGHTISAEGAKRGQAFLAEHS